MLICLLDFPHFAFADSPSDTLITNRAVATYRDDEGTSYSTASLPVVVSIMSVPGIAVTPDETSPTAIVAPNEQITRLFRICNTGNTDNTYLPTRADASSPAEIQSIHFDIDNSGTVSAGDIPVQIGQTQTPRLARETCLNVLFVVDTKNSAPQTQLTIGLSAQSTMGSVNGSITQDSGTIVNTVGNSVTFTSPGNANLLPPSLVENQPRITASPGQILNYSINFRNNGSVTARQVRVVEDLHADLEYVPGSLRHNNIPVGSLSGSEMSLSTTRRVELLIPELRAGELVEIQFQARVSSTVANGAGIVNFASISALYTPTINTTEAVAVISPVGTIYSANSGGVGRIAGAQISISTDPNEPPLNLASRSGFAPNPENQNPFVSDSTGGFGFMLSPGEIGNSNNPSTYYVKISAPLYRQRLLELAVKPDGLGGLFQIAIRSRDGQPLALSNSFVTTSEVVETRGLGTLVFNIPMFTASGLEISKNADKQFAEIGDIVSYRIQAKNAATTDLQNVVIRDTLPSAFVYAAGTAQIETAGQRRDIEPEVNGNQLIFNISSLHAGSNLSISYRVRIGANANEGEHINSALATGIYPDGSPAATEPARAVVTVRGGVFSMRQIVIGRVFEDRNRNGQFDASERPVAGARIYTNNGQSVVTDSAGLFNLPAVDQGSLVLSIDPVTLPNGYILLDDDGRKSSQSWTRLLRTPIGGGALLRQNFAIAPQMPEFEISDAVKVITAKGSFITVSPAANAPSEPSHRRGTDIQIASLTGPLGIGINNSAPRAAQPVESFSLESNENIEPVPPGKLVVLSPSTDEVVMSPSLEIKARVAQNWKVEAIVNGESLGSASIGETRVDNRNLVTTYSFVGASLRPGPNHLKLVPVGPNEERGDAVEVKVFGRGPVEKLEIHPAKSISQNGGNNAVEIEIRGFDRFGNPAVDAHFSIETSLGKIFARKTSNNSSNVNGSLASRQMLSLENGRAKVQLIGDGTSDIARLKAIAGQTEASADVRFTAEMRPTLMVGLAELSIGNSAPEIASSGDDENMRARLAIFYRGPVRGNNLLTLAYDSRKALNRITGVDRFGGFDPLSRSYPVFGDSSTKFEDAPSNSKIFARLDHERSYVMFGDMEADLEKPALSGYRRKLTGAKLHLENERGDFISLTGARPDTAFARDVIPGGGLSLVRLSNNDILTGSEVVTIEVRDRRNPEIILSRENLIRSVDYNLNAQTGEIFFLRPISTFDSLLNLVQAVVTYEHRSAGVSNFVYTGRAVHTSTLLGLKAGASYIDQQQGEIGSFQLGGFDLEKSMPGGGRLNFETALSRGRFASGVNVTDFYNRGFETRDTSAHPRNGLALRLKLDQPLPFLQSRLVGEFHRSTPQFFNPFGATTTPGSQKLSFGIEMRPSANQTLGISFTDERNKTENVSNTRRTISAMWSRQWRENLKTVLGFDNRRFTDDANLSEVNSNLVTAGVEYRPTAKIELSARREQNLGEADPTYPDQTILGAKYQISPHAKLFFTQRLAAAAITPIGDFSATGFASTRSRQDTAFGIETNISRLGAINGRYQLENGINGSDTFAVIGLQNRWAISKEFSIEAGAERGFLMNGPGDSFVSTTFGASWTPSDDFRTSARYEVRDRNGFGQLFTVGAAGKIGDNWTTLARGQWTRSKFDNRGGSSSTLTGALAYRPLESDKYALLFSYNQRSMTQTGAEINGVRQAAMRDRSDTLSTDGLYQVNKGLELYGRFALRFNGNGDNTTLYASALTYSGQLRAQQRINNYLDFAAEGRWLGQPASGTRRTSMGAELGYWVLSDLRFGVGYNFTGVREPVGNLAAGPSKSGFYFTISSKLSNIFNLFGTSDKRLATTTDTVPSPRGAEEKVKK